MSYVQVACDFVQVRMEWKREPIERGRIEYRVWPPPATNLPHTFHITPAQIAKRGKMYEDRRDRAARENFPPPKPPQPTATYAALTALNGH